MKFRFPFNAKTSLPSNERLSQFTSLCYQFLLGRKPDVDGLDSYVKRLSSGEIDHVDVLRGFLESEEYKKPFLKYDYTTDAEIKLLFENLDVELSENLKQCVSLDRQSYDLEWQTIFSSDRELVVGQIEYGAQHKERFWELCNAMALLIGEKNNPVVLEFGVSEFSGMYKQLFPSICLDCSDRPSEDSYVGFNKRTSLRVSNGNDFIAADLNIPGELLKEKYSGYHQKYDLVIFTEVLEHLTINPVQLLSQLLKLIKTGGYLYLTTPNFFRKENLIKIRQRENPQEIYPPNEGNWDAHHHYREYGLKEMCRFVSEAGAIVKGFYFSSSLDYEMIDTDSEKGNMVFVVQSQN